MALMDMQMPGMGGLEATKVVIVMPIGAEGRIPLSRHQSLR